MIWMGLAFALPPSAAADSVVFVGSTSECWGVLDDEHLAFPINWDADDCAEAQEDPDGGSNFFRDDAQDIVLGANAGGADPCVKAGTGGFPPVRPCNFSNPCERLGVAVCSILLGRTLAA